MDDGLRPVCGVRELAPAFQSGGKPPRSKMSPCSRFPAPLFTRNACSSHSPLANRLPTDYRACLTLVSGIRIVAKKGTS